MHHCFNIVFLHKDNAIYEKVFLKQKQYIFSNVKTLSYFLFSYEILQAFRFCVSRPFRCLLWWLPFKCLEGNVLFLNIGGQNNPFSAEVESASESSWRNQAISARSTNALKPCRVHVCGFSSSVYSSISGFFSHSEPRFRSFLSLCVSNGENHHRSW